MLDASVRVVDADTDLMLRFQAGEANCFDLLVAQYRKTLVHFVYRMVHDVAASEEIVQEAFLRVYLHRLRYVPTARFRTWLYRIASHLALNYVRDHRHEKRGSSLDEPILDGAAPRDLPAREANAEQGLLAEERREAVRRAIEGLPERQKAAVILHKYQALDYDEIAGALRLSESATKSLLFRAYENLRRALQPLLSPR